jgi:hypothetical protein
MLQTDPIYRLRVARLLAIRGPAGTGIPLNRCRWLKLWTYLLSGLSLNRTPLRDLWEGGTFSWV